MRFLDAISGFENGIRLVIEANVFLRVCYRSCVEALGKERMVVYWRYGSRNV